MLDIKVYTQYNLQQEQKVTFLRNKYVLWIKKCCHSFAIFLMVQKPSILHFFVKVNENG